MKKYIPELSASAIMVSALCCAAFFSLFSIHGSAVKIAAVLSFSLILGLVTSNRFKHFFTTFLCTAAFFAVGFLVLRTILLSGGNDEFYARKLNLTVISAGEPFIKMYVSILNCMLSAYCGAAAVYGLKCAFLNSRASDKKQRT